MSRILVSINFFGLSEWEKFGSIPGKAQGLFLLLCLWFPPGGAPVTICCTKDRTGAHSMQEKHLHPCFLFSLDKFYQTQLCHYFTEIIIAVLELIMNWFKHFSFLNSVLAMPIGANGLCKIKTHNWVSYYRAPSCCVLSDGAWQCSDTWISIG